MRSVKSLLLLSQACSGLVAAGVVAFPIHVISARGGKNNEAAVVTDLSIKSSDCDATNYLVYGQELE